MKRVLIESPYKADTPEQIARNVAYAREACRDCLSRGESPYASHLFFTQDGILNDAVPSERRLGIDAGLAWGSAAELTVVYIDLGVTEGMVEGIKRAEAEGRPVEERTLPGWS